MYEMNTASWILLGILVAVAALAIGIVIYRKKKGKGRCACCDKEECPNCRK